RQARDLSVFDGCAQSSRFGLEQRRRCLNANGFGYYACLQGYVDTQLAGHFQVQAFANEFLESRDPYFQSVSARLQELDQVVAEPVRHSVRLDARFHICYHDVGAGYHGARRVRYCAEDTSGVSLSECVTDSQGEKNQEGDGASHDGPPFRCHFCQSGVMPRGIWSEYIRLGEGKTITK